MTLRDLGLDADLERLYRLVLALNSTDMRRLADAISWDVERAVAAIDQLSGLGLVRVRDGDVVAVEPGSAVGSLIEQLEDDLLRRYRSVSATRSELTELTGSYSAARRSDVEAEGNVERITDPEQLRDKIEELSFFTRTSLSTMQPGGPSSPQTLAASRPLDYRGLRRGIEMRIIRERAAVEDVETRTYLLDLVARGARVRVADDEMHRMLLMDQKIAIVPIDDMQIIRGVLVIRQPVLVAGFCGLFERTWARAVELTELEQAEPVVATISAQDRTVLEMLAAGTTDEVAARELSISVRHLRRHVSRLMVELDASSRFAAGVEAARRGWI